MALSDFLAPSLQLGSTVLSAGSQIAKGISYSAVGARKKALSEFEAKQLEQEAESSQGIGMRGAQDEMLKSKIVNSLALARAAASGAGASDPTVLNVLAQTSGESAYRQALAMYEGESQARLDKMRASAARYEGDIAESDAAAASSGANMNALSTVLSGGAKTLSLYDRFWAGDKKTNSYVSPVDTLNVDS